MNKYNDILQNIKEIRQTKGLSQEYMAINLNISQAGYANWEKGKRDLLYSNLLRIAEILKVDVVDIITWKATDATDLPAAKVNEKVSITFEVDPQQRDYLLHLVMGDKIKR